MYYSYFWTLKLLVSISLCSLESKVFSEPSRGAESCTCSAATSPRPKPDISPPEFIATGNVTDSRFDAVIVVTNSLSKLTGSLEVVRAAIEEYAKVDKAALTKTVMIISSVVPSRRIIFAPTGKLNRDYDDVRRFADAGKAGVNRAVDAGSVRPLLIVPDDSPFEQSALVAALGMLQATYVPLEVRETGKAPKLEALGIWCEHVAHISKVAKVLEAFEQGRIIARDIAGSDPERMAAPRVEEYVSQAFDNSGIDISVVSDVGKLSREYPLLAAVNRAADTVERHRARLIFLEYTGEGPINRTIFIVGKGITFDSGGADVKTRGALVGMSKDKSGAGAAAGIMKVISVLRPANLRVVVGMPMVRNSIGEESYVPDEIITSRAGARIKVINSDAEGRMVMADVLCRFKEMALSAVQPELVSISTLTYAAVKAVGNSYSIALNNGPGVHAGIAKKIQDAGEKYGDPFEVSTIRREDYEYHTGRTVYAEVRQAATKSENVDRGHQGPAAFMIMASGLDKHGIDSERPLPYTHIDIAGSSGIFEKIPTSSTVVALAAHYVLETN